MSTVPSIKVLKTIPFKGGLRTYSNRYHFTGGLPADATHWHTLMDNVTTAERPLHAPSSTITEALGYAAGSEVPVAQKTYSLAGTLSVATNSIPAPGEVAALQRYSTAARTTKNHPIYLFNYLHGIAVNGTTSSTVDLIDANLKANMSTYAAAWITGFSDGTLTCKRASPNGAVATGHVEEEYCTHRDFPYQSSV